MTLLTIDALNVVRRIHEANPTPDSPDKVIGTFRSCMASFRRALSEHRPTHAVVVFDHGGNTWRHDLYSGYKAHRTPMPADPKNGLPMLQKDLEESGLSWISIEGIEADDAIAALVEKWCVFSQAKVTVLSTDKDFCQLLSDQVCVYDHFKSSWRDATWVENNFGVRPDQMGDLLALTGDAVDAIPGVEKVGKKTAASWLKQFDNLEKLLSRADQIQGKVGVYLRRDSELARLSKKLVSFKTDMPLGLTWKMLERRYPE